MKKIFKKIKDIFLKIFGKAWWFVVAAVVIFAIILIPSFNPGLDPFTKGIRNETDDGFLKEFYLNSPDSFSINNKGKVVVNCFATPNMEATIDFNTGETLFSNINQVNVDIAEDDYFIPSNLVLTDDDVIYGVRSYYDEENSIISYQSIVRMTDEFEYLGEVCEIDYGEESRFRMTMLSNLHYYNDTVTFAVNNEEGVRLYSIDTKTQALTISDCYPNDVNGTFTSYVIPVDGSFIFLRSDGNVYQTGFNEPLGESIYHFDINAEGEYDHPFFNLATIADGKLYFTDTDNLFNVYVLENGEAVPVFELDPGLGYIVALDSCRLNGSDSDTLIVCLENGILTYTDGKLDVDEPVVTFKPTALMYFYLAIETVLLIVLIAIVINLIVCKKTLLYKHLIIILPIIIFLTIVVSVYAYNHLDEQIRINTNRELSVVCDLAKNEFDGFDFADLMTANENTGNRYYEVREKFDKLYSGNSGNWSKDYVFTVVYRASDDFILEVASDDYYYMPLQVFSYDMFTDLEGTGDAYVSDTVMSIFDDNTNSSRISVFSQINDKDNSGRYYLMVSTDSAYLLAQRENILVSVIACAFLIIVVLTGLIILTSFNTMRVIKKASNAVKQISNGNLSARVNYKSKDELGQICNEVNEMGQNLEKLFDEKDETEKFYYKFVPEKFRELLGKENFTDLALGDAKSCELTVLFCDIRGFSINSEMMTAKENFAFANVIYGKMGPIVRNNNGFVDKYIGDAVMGLFEKPDDAIRCGIELYKTIVLDPKTAEELKVSDINIGIGIHTGMAMVGIVGEEERLSGTVISETVNMSSRLESLTKQYKTAMLVSKDTIDRMADPDSLDLRYLGIVQVAGVNDVTALYEVLDCLPDTIRPQRSANNKDLREAIRLFSLGRRDEAVAALQQLSYSGRNDYVTDLYLDYIRNMSDDDKGNVFRFVRK